ncbi:MAG: FecR family protein, partial [Burkholderiales bacterium]
MLTPRVVLFAALLVPSLALAQAGRVLMAVGDVVAVRGAQELRLGPGAAIESGDTIRLGPNSNAQIRMSDESIVSLRERTVFRIDEYFFSGAVDGREKSLFSLVAGGMRTVTGIIGNLRRTEKYAVRTATATIGIRGTHYTLRECKDDCFEPGGSAGTASAPIYLASAVQSDLGPLAQAQPPLGKPVPNGTYGGVTDGRIGVVNNAADREFGANEFFFVADRNTAPQGLLAPPGFLHDRLEGQNRSRGQKGRETGETLAQGGINAESRPSEVPAAPQPSSFIVTEQQSATGTPVVLPTQNFQGGIGFASPGIDVGDSHEAVVSSLVLDATGTKLESFTGSDVFGTLSGSRGIASFADTGGDSSVATAFWGRWTPGAVIIDSINGVLTPPTGVHWIFGDATPPSVLLSKTGSVSYLHKGGTPPTNHLGQTGVFNGASSVVSVDFTSHVVNGGLFYSVGGVSYSLPITNAGMSFDNNKVAFGHAPVNSGSCSACGATIDAYSLGGTFMGPAGAGLGVTYATTDATAGQTAGAAYFTSSAPPAPTIAGVGALFDSLGFPGEPGDGGGFFAASDLTLSGSGTSTLLLGFTLQAGFHASPDGGPFTSVGVSSGTIINETVPNSLNANWGRWLGGSVTELDSNPTPIPISPTNQFHYLFGPLTPPEVVAAKTGAFPLSLVQGTTPTNNLG